MNIIDYEPDNARETEMDKLVKRIGKLETLYQKCIERLTELERKPIVKITKSPLDDIKKLGVQ